MPIVGLAFGATDDSVVHMFINLVRQDISRLKLQGFCLWGELPAFESAEIAKRVFVVEYLEHLLDPLTAARACFEDVPDRLGAAIVLSPMPNTDETIMHEPTIGTAKCGPHRRWHFPFEVSAHHSSADAKKCVSFDDIVSAAEKPTTAIFVPARLAAKLVSEVFEMRPMKGANALIAQKIPPFALKPCPAVVRRKVAGYHSGRRTLMDTTFVEVRGIHAGTLAHIVGP